MPLSNWGNFFLTQWLACKFNASKISNQIIDLSSHYNIPLEIYLLFLFFNIICYPVHEEIIMILHA